MNILSQTSLSALILLVFTLLPGAGGQAQSPQTFNYQGILRDDTGQALHATEVDILLRILSDSPDGQEVFSETHQTETNAFGLFNLQVGSVNSLEGIAWDQGIYFMEVSVDGQLMGSSQLISVPYALHANTSSDAFSGNYDDLHNAPQGDAPGDMMYWDGEGWVRVEPGSHGQSLTLCNGIPTWGPCDEDNGDEVSDYDGNVYQTVVIGEKEWFAENLRSLHTADGTAISGVFAPDHDEEMAEHYGRLYTWHAAMNGEDSDNSNPGTVQGICPTGWRIPSDAEMIYLREYLGGSSEAGGKLKGTRTFPQDHPRWNSPNAGANNSSGFSGYPAGRINADGSSLGFGTGAYFWTSTESNASNAWGYLLYYSLTGFFKDDGTKDFGFSVRCVRDVQGQ